MQQESCHYHGLYGENGRENGTITQGIGSNQKASGNFDLGFRVRGPRTNRTENGSQ